MRYPITLRSIRNIATAGCLSLLICMQSFAEAQLQQPVSLENEKARSSQRNVEPNEEVTLTGCTDSCCNDGCCGGNCCCESVCCPKCVTEEVKKHCWIVKPELVCIPGFRFECNWNRKKCSGGGNCCDTCTGDDCCCSKKCCCDCAPPACGRVRCINVLEKHEYTCTECGCEWEAKCVRTSKGCCSGKGASKCPSCGCKNGCCAQNESPAYDVELTSAEEVSQEVVEQSKESIASRWTKWLKR